MPTIGLPLQLRRRVPHDGIEHGQDGAGECQDRGGKDRGFGHATTLMTASASAQTPIHSASTAIVPKATRPMPVIASLIGASLDLRSSISVNAGTELLFASTGLKFLLHSLRYQPHAHRNYALSLSGISGGKSSCAASMCDTAQARHSKTYKSGKSSNRDVTRPSCIT